MTADRKVSDVLLRIWAYFGVSSNPHKQITVGMLLAAIEDAVKYVERKCDEFKCVDEITMGGCFHSPEVHATMDCGRPECLRPYTDQCHSVRRVNPHDIPLRCRVCGITTSSFAAHNHREVCSQFEGIVEAV